MKKYFIVSDIHSFYDEFATGLTLSGFEYNNPDHILIVCGDVFDRGEQTLEVYDFLSSLPKKRCILIRGNHESLYFKLLKKNYPDEWDFSNGTVLTFCQIAGLGKDSVYDLRYGKISAYLFGKKSDYYVDPKVKDLWDNIKVAVKKSNVTKWLKSKQWVNYYELDKYVLTHSFIPLKYNPERGMDEEYCIYYGWTQYFEYIDNWREASDIEWEKASWGCPYRFIDAGLFKEENKVLVCGHYRCSEFNVHYLNGEETDHSIYYGDKVIAIDATTALSHQVNVLVIDGDKCYDQHKHLLEKKKRQGFKVETVPVEMVGEEENVKE